MRVSLFVEHPLPRPWELDSEKRMFLEALEQLEHADELGFHGVWVTEHHFQEEYSHSSTPELFLAALSQRTKQIRLGHGIVQMPPAINHPVRVAERISFLDLVSDGRVQFGTGEASSTAELGGFNFDPGRKRDMWLEGLTVALRCMSEAPFTGFQGEFVQVPPRNVVPKPQQIPHPPVWLACTRHQTVELAAKMGLGALTFARTGADEVGPLVERYYQLLAEEGRPLTRAVNPNILVTAGDMMVAPSHEEAVRRIGLGIGFHGYGIKHYYVSGRHHPGITPVWAEYERSLSGEEVESHDAELLEASQRDLNRSDWAKLAQQNAEAASTAHFGVGTPDEVAAMMRRYEATGLDELMFLIPPAAHEHIMESISLLGERVLPEFIERDTAAEKSKAKRMEPVIDRVLERHLDDTPALDPDYWFGGVPQSWDGKSYASEVSDNLAAAAAAAAERKSIKT